jgi:predicted small secreted protein
MKKYSWIVALLAALSLVVIGCDTGGGGGKKDNTKKEIETGEGIAGVWDWSTSDDSKANEDVTLKLVKPPYTQTSKGAAADNSPWDASYATTGVSFPQGNWGGKSTISGTADTVDPTIMRPNGDGKTAETAFKFTGTVKVSADDRAWNTGAQYPMVGWEAVPDTDTLANLRAAWAYSFYIKVNSIALKPTSTATATTDWVFKTAVGAEGFANEQGHEYKHYFGNYQPGAAENFGTRAKDNMTDDLVLGQWHKITVVLAPANADFNMDQDSHIHQWNTHFTADFDPTTATKIQWQIALQDQKGILQRAGDPNHYDIPNGYFDYDIEFYGLELYLPE